MIQSSPCSIANYALPRKKDNLSRTQNIRAVRRRFLFRKKEHCVLLICGARCLKRDFASFLKLLQMRGALQRIREDGQKHTLFISRSSFVYLLTERSIALVAGHSSLGRIHGHSSRSRGPNSAKVRGPNRQRAARRRERVLNPPR